MTDSLIEAFKELQRNNPNETHVSFDQIYAYIEHFGRPSEISVLTPRSSSLPDLLDALEIHLVDYPTPENIHMQRKYLSDIRQHHLKPVSVSLQKAWEDFDRLSHHSSTKKKFKDALGKTLDAAGVAYVD